MSLNLIEYRIPGNWTSIRCVDMHTGGEPLRIPISGLPSLHGKSVLEKRNYFKSNLDYLRTGLMFEPRGHADMYGAIISEPSSEDADFDAFFIHNEGYSTMCGHAIIALVRYAVAIDLCPGNGKKSFVINVPAGKVYAHYDLKENGEGVSIFENVPSFVFLKDQTINIEGVGRIHFDIAYGGAFYAIVNSEHLNVSLEKKSANELIDLGRRIKVAIANDYSIKHPSEPDLSFLYGVIFTGPSRDRSNHSRNVCIFADGEVDRSSTGTGVSARAALHYAQGELSLHEPITIESIIGSTMTVQATKATKFFQYDAIIPEVRGTAFFTGHSTFYFDPEDPLKEGFILR